MAKLWVFLLFVALVSFTACGGGGGEEEPPPPVKSAACSLLTFSLKIATNYTTYPGGWVSLNINQTQRTIYATVEKPEISMAAIQAQFTISPKATITVNGVPQASGVTSNNYNNVVVFRVTAEDGVTKKDYSVHVTRLAN